MLLFSLLCRQNLLTRFSWWHATARNLLSVPWCSSSLLCTSVAIIFLETKLSKSVSQRVSSGQQFAAIFDSPVRTFHHGASHASVESTGKLSVLETNGIFIVQLDTKKL